MLDTGRASGLLLTRDMGRMLARSKVHLGDQRATRSRPPRLPRFAQKRPVRVVYGPGTFINEAAGQVLDRIDFDRSKQQAEGDRAARAARRLAAARGLAPADQKRLADAARQVVDAKYTQRALESPVRYGLSSAPALNSPDFVLRLVFAPALGAETPKPRFAYLFPDRCSADPGAPAAGAERGAAQGRDPQGARGPGGKDIRPPVRQLCGVGDAVVVEGVASSITDELGILLSRSSS